MNIYLLRPIAVADGAPWPWSPWYDKAFGFVVRAETEEEARQLADAEAGDENNAVNAEGYYIYGPAAAKQERHPWLLAEFSTCVILTADGDAGVIIKDFASA